MSLVRFLILILSILLAAGPAYSATVWVEDFEDGDFDGTYIGDSNCNTVSFPDLGGDRGTVWLIEFQTDDGQGGNCSDRGFGYSIQQTWASSSTIYIRMFVKYGDAVDAYTWDTAERSHELKFPDFSSGDNRILGKHRGSGSNGYFNLYTPQGPGADDQNHLVSETQFVSNTWYEIQVMLQDNGSTGDIVKQWINNSTEGSPDYSYTSTGNLFDATEWTNSPATPFKFTYRNHAVSAVEKFYVDDLEISTTFITSTDSQAPTFVSASISTDGDSTTAGFSEAVVTTLLDAGDFSMTCSTTGSVDLTYSSGSGTDTIVFTNSATVDCDDTCTISYTGTTDPAEVADGSGNPLAQFSNEPTSNGRSDGCGAASTSSLSGASFSSGGVTMQ